jgi:spore coat polysaccharide biosynthesis protein SpsF (cytidylyltransferase family)
MEKAVVVIQARMGSTRLPGKILREIAGRPMLEHVVERVREADQVGLVAVATTTGPEDDRLEAWGAAHDVPVYRGSELDVLDRYYQTVSALRGQVDLERAPIVRITSDCPLIDAALIDEAVELQARTGADYVSNKVRPTLPIGEDIEVFLFAGLEQAWREAKQDYERVHVTPYFYRNPEKFRLEALVAEDGGDYTAHRWTVDTPEDLAFMNALHAAAGGIAPGAGWREILAIVEAHPEISAINGSIRQKSVEEC